MCGHKKECYLHTEFIFYLPRAIENGSLHLEEIWGDWTEKRLQDIINIYLTPLTQLLHLFLITIKHIYQ